MLSAVLITSWLVAFGEPSPEAPSLEARGSVEWLTAGRWTELAHTPLNPGNAMLAYPQAHVQTELRPNLKLEHGHMLAAVFRPRVLATWDAARFGGAWDEGEADAELEWSEAYLTWRLSDELAMSLGRQNFQWGPAELMSPSNRIFHESGLTRDALYHVRGRDLLRVNASVGSRFSAVLLVELEDNDEPQLVPLEKFTPRAQLKAELTTADGASYLGLTGGGTRDGRGFVGEYAQLTVSDGLFVYADATHAMRRDAFYPQETPLGPALLQLRDREKPTTLAVGGLRYNFETGEDIRLEYVYQDGGYTAEEIERAYDIVRANPILLPVFAQPGLEVLGRSLVYASVRLPELPPKKHLMLQFRYLRSLTDQSGAAFFTASLDATDSLVAFVSAYGTHGSYAAELSRFVRASLVLGVVQTW